MDRKNVVGRRDLTKGSQLGSPEISHRQNRYILRTNNMIKKNKKEGLVFLCYNVQYLIPVLMDHNVLAHHIFLIHSP